MELQYLPYWPLPIRVRMPELQTQDMPAMRSQVIGKSGSTLARREPHVLCAHVIDPPSPDIRRQTSDVFQATLFLVMHDQGADSLDTD